MMRARFVTISLLVLALVPSPAAEARSPARRAKRLFERGNVHFNLGEYSTALRLYRDAYTVKPLPGFLFNIGQCHFNLDEHEKAIAAYERYLSEQPDAPNRDVVQKQIRRAREALQRKRDEEAALQAASQPAAEGEPQHPPADAPADAAGGPPPAAAPTAPTSPPTATPEDRPPPASRLKKAVLWTGVALSGALLATGAVTRGIALGMSSEYKKPSTPLARQLSLADRGETLTTLSNVTLIAGGALAVATGLYYWFGYRGRRAKPAAAVAVAPLLDAGGALISVGGGW